MCDKSRASVYSYSANWNQRVKLGSEYSTFQNISTGIPQGSVLSPLLFNIFMNDMFYLDLKSEICNFADDTRFAHAKNLLIPW